MFSLKLFIVLALLLLPFMLESSEPLQEIVGLSLLLSSSCFPSSMNRELHFLYGSGVDSSLLSPSAAAWVLWLKLPNPSIPLVIFLALSLSSFRSFPFSSSCNTLSDFFLTFSPQLNLHTQILIKITKPNFNNKKKSNIFRTLWACCLADLSHRRRICSGVVQETADQPSTVVDVSPAVASAQPRRRFPPPSRLLPGTVASQPSLLPRSTG
nr:hypothetical protein Iba_chr07eCG3540 [Ipomoea batatas]